MTSAHQYHGCRSTRDGGKWEWSPGNVDSPPPLDAISDFIRAADSAIDKADRYAQITVKLNAAEAGDLVMFVKPEEWHDVRPVSTRAPQLLELRWTHTAFASKSSGQWRLYFCEPVSAPEAIVGLRFAEKVDVDAQDQDIDLAEVVRVEGKHF